MRKVYVLVNEDKDILGVFDTQHKALETAWGLLKAAYTADEWATFPELDGYADSQEWENDFLLNDDLLKKFNYTLMEKEVL